MAFRESPVKKRRKITHSVDEEDAHPEELLHRFQRPVQTFASESKRAEPAPPSRDSSHSILPPKSSSSNIRGADITVKADGSNVEATETSPGPATTQNPGSPASSEDSVAAAAARRLSNQRKERDWLTVKNNWGEEPYQRYADCSEGSMELLAYLSKRFQEKTARHYILNETLLRLTKPEPPNGRATTRVREEITYGDIRAAKENIMSKSRTLKDAEGMQPLPLKEELLKRFNLRVGASGLLEPAPASAQAPGQPSGPPKKAKESKESSSSTTPSATLKDPAKPARKKTDLKAKNVVDLTTEEPTQAPVKNKLKLGGYVFSDPIAIDDSTSTGRSTPVANTKKSSKGLQKTSASATKPVTKAVNISDSAHSTTPLPVSKLKPNKKRISSAVDATLGVKPAATSEVPSDMQRPIQRTVGDQQTPTVKHATSVNQTPDLKQPSNVNSPSSAKPVPSPSNSAGSQTPRSASDNRAYWSREDDSLMVYLKTVFGWGPTRLADALGRTSGACSTRYSTKLRNGQITLQEAIDCLSNSSQFSHHLDPAAHNHMLAGTQASAAGSRQQPSTAVEMTHSSMPKKQSPPQIISKPHNLLQTTEDESSDQSLSTAPGRAKRTRPKVEYDVKKYFSGHMDIDVSTNISSPAEPVLQQVQRQGGPHETTNIQPKKIQPKVRKTYKYKKPYLASHERQSLQSGLNEGTWEEEVLKKWRGVSVHIGLNPQELLKLEEVIVDVLRKSQADRAQSQARGRIDELMRDTVEADVFEIATIASQRKALPDRTKESIEAALRDAQDGCLLNTKTTLSEGRPTAPSITSIVRQRELGRNLGVPTTMKTMILDTIGPSMSFTGTSNDVNTVAWAPNGVHFAAGSACHVDSDSMQYNRPNNLLFGSIHERTLLELPEHHTLRERPPSGPNSSNAMHVTQDRRLFQTVAAVCFSPDGKSMYSAGYDGMLRMWDVKESGARQRLKVFRNAKIDLLAVSKNGLLATGAQRTTTNAITVFDPNQSGDLERWSISGFNSRRAAQRPENKIYPSTIRFDPYAGKYLLAGFASTSREELTCGESCLWDLRSGTQLHLFPETRNVFDVAWNPSRSSHLPDFAVGCVAGSNVNRGVRSVVKMYDIRSREKCGMSIELDCPALDMNDVIWCPYDENLLVAGCTNGKTYVWDVRRAHPEIHLYSLEHDQPLMELADPENRERLDTGIRFCSWGHDKNRFYTGSSDGVVKSWDLYRSREDALVRNVIQLNSGVMCGSFSPEYTSLLLGEVNGTINVLEVGKEDQSIRDVDSFNLKSAPSPPKRPPGDDNSTAGDDSGVAASKTLMQTGQIVLVPMGGFPVRQALQGPAYAGPFDSAMDAEDLRDKAAVFQENLASASDEQCKIEGCIVDCEDEDEWSEPIHKFTEEECGDSGRWKDRIPAALTLRPKLTDTDVENIPKQRLLLGVTPSLKCSAEGCDRPVRLRPDDKEQNFRCERHNFGTLRPGHDSQVFFPLLTVDNRRDALMIGRNGVSRGSEVFDQKLLEMVLDQTSFYSFPNQVIYRADVLGYKELPESREKTDTGCERPISRTWGRRIYGDNSVAQEENNDCGMDEWHASLWGLEEAPDAPPFLPASLPPQPGLLPSASRSVSRAARRDSPKYFGEHRAAPPSPGLPDNGAQQGGGGADAQSATPLDSLDRQGGHDDGDGGVRPMVWESTPQEQGQMQRQMQSSVAQRHAHDQEESRGGDAMDLDPDPRQQSTKNAIPIESGSAEIRTNAGGLALEQQGDSAAATAVRSVEEQNEGIGRRRRSSIASSSQHSAASNKSDDSNRSRTPCVPM